jgi:deoxyguanosine kinase
MTIDDNTWLVNLLTRESGDGGSGGRGGVDSGARRVASCRPSQKMERARYIAVEGPIGVGKTTLATALEEVEENPFLASFYQDPKKYAFQTQLFFLLSRFQQQQQLYQHELFSQVSVADYLFAKDRIFAALTLDPNELALYERVWELMGTRVVKPDLVVYLQARLDVLLARIRRRGRDFEQHFDAGYLDALCKAYSDFFFHYDETPLLVVNTSDIDLEAEQDLEPLIGVIRKHKKGIQHYIPLGTRS